MFRLLAVFLVAGLVWAGAGLWLHNGLEAASVPGALSSIENFTPASGLGPLQGSCTDQIPGGGEISFDGIGTPNHTAMERGDVCPGASDIWTFSTILFPMKQYIGVMVDEKIGSVKVDLLLPDGSTVQLEPGSEYRASHLSNPAAYEVTVSGTETELAGYHLQVCRSILFQCEFAASSSGVMIVDCNVGMIGIQINCDYLPGTSFDVEVQVTTLPVGGYFGFQAKLRWTEGTVNYLPTLDPAEEALWPGCTLPERIDNQPADPSVVFGCSSPSLSTPNTLFTGPVLRFELQCKGAPGSSEGGSETAELQLVPREGDLQQGTYFVDDVSQLVDPALVGATINCVEKPGAMAIDCSTRIAGVQTDCTHLAGSTFPIEIRVTEPPTGGYLGFSGTLLWTDGILNYEPTTNSSDEALWPLCDSFTRVDGPVGDSSVGFDCSQAQPTEGDTFTGAVLRIMLQCKAEPSTSIGVSPPIGLPQPANIELLSVEQDSTHGTTFVNGGMTVVEPALSSASITCSPDDDGDGCTNAQELGSSPSRGGQRDPNSFWDFFDTPNGENLRDRAIGGADIGRVVLRFGTSGTLPLGTDAQVQAALSAPPAEGYHPAFDRTPVGPDVWNLGPPNGSVTAQDIALVILQFGHTCWQ